MVMSFSKLHTGNFPRETHFSGRWGVKDNNKFKNVIYFKGGARGTRGYQVSLLSNLALGPMFEFEGLSFFTAEHAYMAHRVDAESRERFSVTGDLGCFENMKKNPKTMAWWLKLAFNKKGKNFWEVNSMDGQIAKQATKEDACKILKLKIVTKTLPSNDEEWELWKFILSAKFAANANARDVLLASDNCLLVETARFQPELSKWGGLVKNGVLLGNNTMGRYLCRVREMIKNQQSTGGPAKEKSAEVSDQDENSDVEQRTAGKYDDDDSDVEQPTAGTYDDDDSDEDIIYISD